VGLNAAAEPTEAQMIEYATLARVRIAQGRVEPDSAWLQEASALLGRMLAMTEAGGRTGQTIEVLALQALAAEAAGDRETALPDLGRALALAEPEGYVRTFVDEGEAMAGLLAALLAARRHGKSRAPRPSPEYLEHLLAAFGSRTSAPPQPAPPAGAQRLAEPLTKRELEVLRLMAAGASNDATARTLVVGASTVKTRVNRVFRKLGAGSRTEAVARARAVHLVD
jgi:LuxR family maltose regulon positive regulatory protein